MAIHERLHLRRDFRGLPEKLPNRAARLFNDLQSCANPQLTSGRALEGAVAPMGGQTQ